MGISCRYNFSVYWNILSFSAYFSCFGGGRTIRLVSYQRDYMIGGHWTGYQKAGGTVALVTASTDRASKPSVILITNRPNLMGVQFLHPWWSIAELGIVHSMVLRTLGETSPRSRCGVCGLGTWSSSIAAVSETAPWP